MPIPDYYQSLIDFGFRSWIADEERNFPEQAARIKATRASVQSKGYAGLTEDEIRFIKVAALKFEPELDLNPGAKRERQAKAEMLSCLDRIFPRAH